MKTATPRSRALLEKEGWLVAVVEHWNDFTKRRHDLFGLFDLLAVKDGVTLAVQPTTSSNVSARVRKITDSEHIDRIRAAGWKVEVHGWRKVKNRWQVKRLDLS